MKKQILSACVAALSLVACREPKPVEVTVAPILEQPMPEPSALGDAGRVELTLAPERIDSLGIPHEDQGVDHLGQARTLQSEGDLGGALVEARKAVFDAPSDEDALELVGALGQRVGNKEASQDAYGRLAALRTDDALPLIRQGRVLLSMGDFEGASRVGIEAISRDPESPEGYQLVGRAQLSSGDLTGAIESFLTAVEKDPAHGFALNNLGFAYLRANENEKAVEVLEQAAELLPHIAYVHNNLGVALERVGRIEEAKLAYGTATSLSPKYVKARINSDRMAKASLSTDEDGSGVSPEE